MKSFWKKIFFFLMIFLIFLAPVFSRKKKNADKSASEAESSSEKSSAESSENDAENAALEFASETTKLPLPAKKDRSFFASVSPEILFAVYDGSSDSLQKAISSLERIGKDERQFPENVLLSVSISMMQILWPSVRLDENLSEIPEIKEDNAYTSAISSARNGMYDFNTGNSDFLSRALPSLVLAVSNSRDDYYDESDKNLTICLGEKDDSVFVNYLYALLCRRQKKYEDAASHLQAAFSSSPESQEIQFALAENYYDTKNYDEAEKLADSLFSKNSSNRNYLKLCAYVSFANGKLEKAEQYVNRVLQTEPTNSEFLLFRTKILIEKKEYIRAASLLDAYARTDSSSRDYLFLRFTVQKDWNKNITAATETIQKALELYPDDVEIMTAAASLASENNVSINGYSGEELAAQILEKEPENYEAKKIKVESLVQKENWSEAYTESSELVKKLPSDESVLFTHVKICLESGKSNEAWRIASNLYSQNPNDENVLQCYVDVLVSTSRKTEASKIIASLLPSASARMKSFLYYERSFLDVTENEILADLRSSLTSNPRNRDSLLRLYRIYFNKKEYRKAQYYLKQVVAISPKDEKILEMNRQLDELIN